MKQQLKSILLIEDDEAHVELFSFYAAKWDAALHIENIRDGATARDRLRQLAEASGTIPDLIILDLNLPKFSGIDLLECIREDPRTRALPCLIFTSSTSTCDLNQAWDIGVHGYMEKPTSAEGFASVVTYMLDYWANNEKPNLKAVEG